MFVTIDEAVERIKAGVVVAFPTETVYGLGARIHSENGIQSIFSTKDRPFFDPLIVHVSSMEQAQLCFSEWPKMAQILVQNFWPGPLTLVMNKSELISEAITSGLVRVGVRYPNHAIALEIIQKVGEPIAAPSANKFGKTSPTSPDHVESEFNGKVAVVKAEPSSVGIESTVLLIADGVKISILRKGMITKSEVELCLKTATVNFEWIQNVDRSQSPGHLRHHYMPSIPLVLFRSKFSGTESELLELHKKFEGLPDQIQNVTIVKPNKNRSQIVWFKLPTDAKLAARVLYSELRLASQKNADILAFQIESFHHGELWESVFDRLYKAASLVID